MNRRGFFAALVAPIVAKWMPSPKSPSTPSPELAMRLVPAICDRCMRRTLRLVEAEAEANLGLRIALLRVPSCEFCTEITMTVLNEADGAVYE